MWAHDIPVVRVKARSDARKIWTQHLATLLDRVLRCCEGAGQTRATSWKIQNCFNKSLTIFKLDPTPSNIFRYVATGWSNVCNTLLVTMSQDVVLTYCLCFVGPFGLGFGYRALTWSEVTWRSALPICTTVRREIVGRGTASKCSTHTRWESMRTR